MLENRLMTLSEVQVVKQGYDEMGLLGAAQEAMSCNVRGEAAGRKRALPPPCLRTPPPRPARYGPSNISRLGLRTLSVAGAAAGGWPWRQ